MRRLLRSERALALLLLPTLLWSVSFILHSSKIVSPTRSIKDEVFQHRLGWTLMSSLNNQTLLAETPLHPRQDDGDCFRLNSRAWLQGQRFGNVQNMDWIDLDILPPARGGLQGQYWKDLLDQSICSDQSRFKSLGIPHVTNQTNATIRSWTMKLIYWSMHYHQTRHARAEAHHRQQLHRTGKDCHDTSSQSKMSQPVGPYDYECPNARYIVASLADIGFGANVRGGMVYGYLAGLISDRVVLWMNDSPIGNKFLRRPWALVSCDEDLLGINSSHTPRKRRDSQCFLLPSSPCVLTKQDIEQAYPLNSRETQQLLKRGAQPKGHERDKVWFMKLGFTPVAATPKAAAERLHKYAHQLIQEHLGNTPTSDVQQQQKILHQAADNILSVDEPRRGYNYGAANVKTHHALVVYAMRLRRDKARQSRTLLEDLVKTNNLNPELSFGLPIRASDKCDRESECLSFEKHMQATLSGTTLCSIKGGQVMIPRLLLSFSQLNRPPWWMIKMRSCRPIQIFHYESYPTPTITYPTPDLSVAPMLRSIQTPAFCQL